MTTLSDWSASQLDIETRFYVLRVGIHVLSFDLSKIPRESVMEDGSKRFVFKVFNNRGRAFWLGQKSGTAFFQAILGFLAQGIGKLTLTIESNGAGGIIPRARPFKEGDIDVRDPGADVPADSPEDVMSR